MAEFKLILLSISSIDATAENRKFADGVLEKTFAPGCSGFFASRADIVIGAVRAHLLLGPGWKVCTQDAGHRRIISAQPSLHHPLTQRYFPHLVTRKRDDLYLAPCRGEGQFGSAMVQCVDILLPLA